MGRQAWKKGVFLTVSLFSAAFFCRLERISQTVYLGERQEATEEEAGSGQEADLSERSTETARQTETEQHTEKAAEAEKQAAILRAEAKRESMIREAEGQAEAIKTVQQASADGIRMLNDAQASKEVLQLKSLEAFSKAADGKATKIIIPSEIQGMAGLAKSFSEVIKDN